MHINAQVNFFVNQAMTGFLTQSTHQYQNHSATTHTPTNTSARTRARLRASVALRVAELDHVAGLEVLEAGGLADRRVAEAQYSPVAAVNELFEAPSP